MLHRRHFTVEQANELVPAVARILQDVDAARRSLSVSGLDTDLALHAEATGGAWPGRRRAEASLVLTLGFEQLEELGVVVRDVERGIVDFPALMGGREVYLCWHAGEDEVGHWHGLQSGFAGRRPLPRPARRP